MKSHILGLASKQYLDLIREGKKTFEGRLCRPSTLAISVGDTISFSLDSDDSTQVLCLVTSKDEYNDFESMLIHKGIDNMLPFLKGENSQHVLKKAVDVYRSFPSYKEEEYNLGCVAFGLKPILKSE